MAIVNMPALSPTMTEGKLAKWLVRAGDTVASGDVIAEIETDKALMEVEALDDGVMASILVAEGSDAVPVGTPIAEILGEGEESMLAKEASPPESQPVEPAPAVDKPVTEQPKTAPVQDEKAKTIAADHHPKRIFASPLAKRIAGQKNIDLAAVTGTGPHGRIIKADIASLPDSFGADGFAPDGLGADKAASSASMVNQNMNAY